VFADAAVAATAGLVPPQVTRLALRLPPEAARPPDGWPALSVAELAEALGRPAGPGSPAGRP
jgi:hypothetical protein